MSAARFQPHRSVRDLAIAEAGATDWRSEVRGWLMLAAFAGLFWAIWTMTP